MTQPKISRRTVLKGVGGLTIGLPLLEEMMVSRSWGAPDAEVPTRAFNVFFGLGIPSPLQEEGYDGVLEPLKPLQDKLLIMRHVDQVRCDAKGINAHFDGSSGAFTATPPNGEAKAGGASIDQLVRRSSYPDGLPNGMVSTLVAGTFFRRSRVSRYVHSYNPDGSVAATMQEKPRDLFDRVFGTLGFAGEGDLRKERLNRSVLDTVVDQYKFYAGQNSPLGKQSRARIATHLERIREFELRAYEMKEKHPLAPDLPQASDLAHGGEADPGGEGIDMALEDLTAEWRLMADLYALAIQVDRVRFGSITFLAAGERLRIKGNYQLNDKTAFQFDDEKQLGKSGSGGCSHEWWHRFNEQKKNEQLRAHAHMKMQQVAYFLHRLDGPDAQEANGRSILENSMITVSTESGDGRHSDSKRELSGIFHAITGANNRFKTGQILDVKAEGVDVYNTMLSGMGVKAQLGPQDREHRPVEKIRA